MSSATSRTPTIMPCKTFRGHDYRVNGVVHLPDGRHIVTCSPDSSIRLWDLESGAQIGEKWFYRRNTIMWCIVLSPNGKTIASTSTDASRVRFWDAETREVVITAILPEHYRELVALSWSQDGKRMLSGSSDGVAIVWDIESRKTVLKIKTGHDVLFTVRYLPDGTRIATGGLGTTENAVQIWDAKTGELLNTLKHDDAEIRSLTCTSDGKKLISGSGDRDPIRIFDTTTWQEIAVLKLEGHRHWINGFSLSQNNRILASASQDKTVRLWNLDTNLPIEPPLQHECSVQCAAFSADGKLLVTGSEDKNAHTWDIHAILKEAGLEDLLQPLPDVELMSIQSKLR